MTSQIFTTIVLYKKSARDSATVDWYLKQADSDALCLIWDNSPDSHERWNDQTRLEFQSNHRMLLHFDANNPGLAVAYNHALNCATEAGCKWLLTFDQDTVPPRNYLDELEVAISSSRDNGVVAFCPLAFESGKQFSPIGTRHEIPWPNDVIGTPGHSNKPISAINSGLCVSVDFLKSMGGYNPDFPLDYLDHWLCREAYRRGYRISVLPVAIEHSLSLNKFEQSISLGRYQSILNAQRSFVFSCRGVMPRLLYIVIMLRHTLLKFTQAKEKKFARVAWREFARSLSFWRKTHPSKSSAG